MVQTVQKSGYFTNTFNDNREKFDALKGIEEKALQVFDQTLPDNKARPSLLQPLCHGLGLAGGLATAALGENRSYQLFKIMEDTIQKEHDSLLRKLNDNEIEDKATRKLLTSTRDIGYDYFEQNHKGIDANEAQDTDLDKYLKTATRVITTGLLKASSKL